MNWKDRLFDEYSHGEIINYKDQNHYCWSNWFLEFFVGPTDSDTPFCYLQFELNFDTDDQKIFQRAKSAGLLPFHYYAQHAKQLKEELELKLDFFEHTNFKTHYLVESNSGDELLDQIQIIKQNHITIMEHAMRLIRELNSKYGLLES